MKRFLNLICYLLAVHLSALAAFTFFRMVFYLTFASQVAGDATPRWPAFVRGLWIDNVMVCYAMVPALAVALVAGITGLRRRGTVRGLGIWFGVVFSLLFMASAANVPYYDYFARPLNSSIWQWFIYPEQTAGMVFGETSWLKYIVLWLVAAVAFCLWLRFLGKYFWRRIETVPARGWRRNLRTLLVSLPLLGLCIFGIRGRTGYQPIKISAAYYCTTPLLNHTGVNAAFSLLQTTNDDLRPENRALTLMDEKEALGIVQQELGRTGIDGISPLARSIEGRADARRYNVVIVLMESLSANLMERFGANPKLAPVLNGLWRSSMSFPRFYSTGNHTNQGIYATLYGFPSIMKRNSMKGSTIPRYSGLPTVLHEAGYHTLFFMTHEKQYDNMNAFLLTNGFDEVFGQEDYPRDKWVTRWGVADDYLLLRGIELINERTKDGRPFLATLLTIQNHPPFVVPAYFKSRFSDPGSEVVAYADWSIGRFLEEARKQPWYANTIFLFLGDHGKVLGETQYEVPESFNHIPLMIFGPGIEAGERSGFGLQQDVMPTVLGMLGQGYIQNNFGIDLLREKRTSVYYSTDNAVVARDSTRLFIYSPDADKEFFYDVSTPQFRPLQPSSPEAQPLRRTVFANLQTVEMMMREEQTTDRKK